MRDAHIGRFKPLADFDWSWPEQIDRAAVEDPMTLQFLADASNVVLVGPNGGEVFPNAACVVSLVDRLMHRAEGVRIEGESYRAREAQERAAARARPATSKSGGAAARKGKS